jgi:hypothetical protein
MWLWKNMTDKINPIKTLIKPTKTIKLDLVTCIDLSGSTGFTDNFSHDGKPFSEIYAQAIHSLLVDIKYETNIVVWSNQAREVTGTEKEIVTQCVNNMIPMTDQIEGMNEGTCPQNIIPLIKNRNCIIVTDGEIGDAALRIIKQSLDIQCGNIYLIIVPHIDSYKKLYAAGDHENNVTDNINISIPQAFSTKLTAVFVWNYNKKTFDLVKELLAPSLSVDVKIADLVNIVTPVYNKSDMIVNYKGIFHTFNFDELINFCSKALSIEDVKYLYEYQIHMAIRQNGSEGQKDMWNAVVKKMYVESFNTYLKDNPVPESVVESDFKLYIKNKKAKVNKEKEFDATLGCMIKKLYIDKVVGEMKTIGSARQEQTRLNVATFQKMNVNDKIQSLAKYLLKGVCSICDDETNVFSVINIPTDLSSELRTCNKTISFAGKKGKTQTKKVIDIVRTRKVLSENKPHLHYTQMCETCSQEAITQLKHYGDLEYGITKFIPQNIDATGVKNRLYIVPLIDKAFINTSCDPNAPYLSGARQMFRGLISLLFGLEPASQDCGLAALTFLTSLSNADNASTVYHNQLSIIRGGSQDKYPGTIGRLFEPSVTKIGKDNLTMISIVYEVIDKIDELRSMVNPSSAKLLLLCNIERRVAVLRNAGLVRDRAIVKLDSLLGFVKDAVTLNEFTLRNCVEFDIMDADVCVLKACTTVKDFITNNQQSYMRMLATFLNKYLRLKLVEYSDECIRNLLVANDIDTISGLLDMDKIHLRNYIKLANMEEKEFVDLLPTIINSLINTDDPLDTILSFV